MIYVDQSLNLIQQIRALHAIEETGTPICINKDEAYKLKPLNNYFNMNYLTDNCQGVKFSQIVKINHKNPTTSIGNTSRSLLFPKAITNHLRRMWQNDRMYKFSFAGLVTPDRKNIIENWLKNIMNEKNYQLPNDKSMINRIIKKISTSLNLNLNDVRQYGDFNIWSSTRGRVFPIKSWDEDYFKFLSQSEFVLCPSGDYTWSYRFFESILCGAIPIVEEYCDAYDGFRFKSMANKADELVWNKEDIEYNYNLCLERITIPQEIIESEIVEHDCY